LALRSGLAEVRAMTHDDWDDLLNMLPDGDDESSLLSGLRHRRPIAYYGLRIGIVVVLGGLVHWLLW
jgi:hypothetical protein